MNPDNFVYWHTGLEKYELVQGRPGEVDWVGRLHYSKDGNSYVVEDKLVYMDPGRKYVSQITGDTLTAKVETTLISQGNMTEVYRLWSGRAKALPLRLMLPFLRGKMMKQSRAELEAFKELVESRGADFSA